jgi:structural maintenance of chromosome 4
MSDEFPDEGAGRVLTDEELLNDVGGPMPSKYEGRLVLTKMVLENFKSYGGVKEIGPFHSSMSAVVGPNGSGKSNVIDALQFCLGRRATKLRLKKISQLIHSSTEHPDCQSCSVTVHFQMIIDRILKKTPAASANG